MKKLTDFIVDKRYYILAFMLVLCLVCAILLPKVGINKDMTQYLPDDSPMKEGLDIMKEEFPIGGLTGQIRVMFHDLEKEKIPEIIEKLQGIEGVTGVLHDDTEAYNKDGYTLFGVQCDYAYDTPEEIKIEKAIRDMFQGSDMIYQHTDAIISDIPVWVYFVVLAVLLGVLFFMCSSYLEPFLFLATIGIAIVMNMGSNLMFGKVSETTYTLSAVLQLALSMDYSIILMNRYRQAKATAENKVAAMKTAWRGALPSVLSSGMTTVIGLIMLIFMRFKIGMDLGLVMAKGVALSMICVLTVLPALILIFDKGIEKTKKKSPHIPTKGCANYAYRGRKVLCVVFAVLFVSMLFLQNLTTITFAQPKDMRIENVFPSQNPVVILFENKDEEQLRELLPQMEKIEGVDHVMGYMNTLDQKMTADEMAKAIEGFGMKGLDSSMLSLVFYEKYRNGEVPSLTMEQFLSFLLSDVIEDEKFAGYFDENVKQTLQKLKPFANREDLITPKTADEMAETLGMNKEQVEVLYAYYLSQPEDSKPEPLTLSALGAFLQSNILKNPLFAPMIPEESKATLNKMLPIMDKEAIETPRTPAEMAQFMGMEESLVSGVYMLKGAGAPVEKLSAVEFVRFLATEGPKNPAISSQLDPATFQQLGLMNAAMQLVRAETPLDYTVIASFLGMEPGQMKLIYTYKEILEKEEPTKVSLQNFLPFLVGKVANDPVLGQGMTAEQKTQLTLGNGLAMLVIANQPYTVEQMFNMLKLMVPTMKQEEVELLYLYYGANHLLDPKATMTLEEFVAYASSDFLSSPFGGFVDAESREMLQNANKTLQKTKSAMKGPEHSLLLLDTHFKSESPETTKFIKDLEKSLSDKLTGKHYLVGFSPMNVEMEDNFKKDLTLITLLTAFAIFIVVAITFKSLLMPLVLVLMVQCGVYITVAFSGVIGHSMYYLSLLVVQCILMGATIDYGIVFTGSYKENRRTLPVKEALHAAFRQSIHTVLTSGLILSLITGCIGICPADPAITEICQTLAVGTVSAILLILFILPGMLAAMDRFVVKKKKGSPSGEIPEAVTAPEEATVSEASLPEEEPVSDKTETETENPVK